MGAARKIYGQASGRGITAGQRKALFAFAASRGLSIDDLRGMTPVGSISRLTFEEASSLLNQLNAGTKYAHPRMSPRGPRRPKGVYKIATAAQLAKIEALRIELGWSVNGLQAWLSERRHVDGRPLTRVESSGDAVFVIELLRHVRSRMEAGDLRRGAGAPREGAAVDGPAPSPTFFESFPAGSCQAGDDVAPADSVEIPEPAAPRSS